MLHSLNVETKAHSIEDYSGVDSVISAIIPKKDGTGVRGRRADWFCLCQLIFKHLSDGAQFIGGHARHLAMFSVPAAPETGAGETRRCTSHPLGIHIPERYLQDSANGTERFNDGAADAAGRLW